MRWLGKERGKWAESDGGVTQFLPSGLTAIFWGTKLQIILEIGQLSWRTRYLAYKGGSQWRHQILMFNKMQVSGYISCIIQEGWPWKIRKEWKLKIADFQVVKKDKWRGYYCLCRQAEVKAESEKDSDSVCRTLQSTKQSPGWKLMFVFVVIWLILSTREASNSYRLSVLLQSVGFY